MQFSSLLFIALFVQAFAGPIAPIERRAVAPGHNSNYDDAFEERAVAPGHNSNYDDAFEH